MFAADEKRCEDFFALISQLDDAYTHAALNYIALKIDDRFEIVQGRVYLNVIDPAWQPRYFESPRIRAGRHDLSDLNLNIRTFLHQLKEGGIQTPQGRLTFSPPAGGRHATSYVPFHGDGLKSQQRYSVLTMMGGPVPPIQQPDLDWEIKAATLPFDGLQELANDLTLGGLGGPTAAVEIVAFNIAAIDVHASKLVERTANIQVIVPRNVDKKKVSIGYRIYAPSTTPQRGIVPANQLQWKEEGQHGRCQTSIEVPLAAVINCTVSYNGIAQHHQWLGDPDRAQNSRRAVFETFDPKLDSLRAAIANASLRGQDARQLEPAVSWLLWLLGFGVSHLGGTPRTRDAADLLVATPSGHFAVIECTTGLLKAENKLSLLYARVTSVRENLAATNNTHLRVLPIIVTSRSRAEVESEIEAAERLGILVLTREWLDAAIDRTLVLPNPEQMYAEAEQTVSTGLAKYKAPLDSVFAAQVFN